MIQIDQPEQRDIQWIFQQIERKYGEFLKSQQTRVFRVSPSFFGAITQIITLPQFLSNRPDFHNCSSCHGEYCPFRWPAIFHAVSKSKKILHVLRSSS